MGDHAWLQSQRPRRITARYSTGATQCCLPETAKLRIDRLRALPAIYNGPNFLTHAHGDPEVVKNGGL